ncbi:MAG TPA: long-chain fatty acid--CoA ligase [Terriglobales bacterium]|nr:long-chain fatty acid--CoA ligase [Terriglobales bacterium]
MCYERGGVWHDISSRELYARVYHTARQLQQWGISKGDRVALIAENRFEWAVADWACLLIGAVDVPIYPTLTAEQTEFILKNSGARSIFLSTHKQLDKILSIKDGTQLEQIVVMDDVNNPAAIRMSAMMGPEEPTVRDANFDAVAQSIVPDDLASIIYTSGTTGTPKGVMLTHGNIASNLEQTARSLGWQPRTVSLSFLPLSHVTARHVDYLCLLRGVTLAYCPSFDELPTKLQQARPHLFVSVPRVYEKVRQEVDRRASAGLKRKAYQWALRVGQRHREETLGGRIPSNWQWRLANKLVFHPIYQWFGGRVQMFVSGGAPLGVDLARWYVDVGIRILEGYGLTETSPVIAVNTPENNKLGTVGKPLANVECRIASDGELLVRGPSIFKKYWNNPEETAKAFEGDWFKTGDIGNIDSDGFLSITDRKKDLIKTSGGKFIAPQPIENKLKMSPLVGHAVVIGNARKFASVVICPNFPVLEQWAREQAIDFHSREDLVSNRRVIEAYHHIVTGVNEDLAQFETLKKILVVPDDFTIAAGEVTPTLKLKRRAIEQKYKQQIDAMYAGGSPAPQPAAV